MALIGAFTACFFVQVFLCRDHNQFFCMKIKSTLCTIPLPPTPLPAHKRLEIHPLSAPPKGAIMLLSALTVL